MVADLKQKNADMVFLAIGASRTPPLLAALVAAGLTPPLFVAGRIETFVEAGAPEYPGDIYQLAWEDLPDVFSDRLRQRIVRNGLDRWLFEGAKIAEAPGWAKGECKARPEADEPNVFDSRNMRAIGRGTQYADMVALVAEALKSADPKSDTAALRAQLLTRLKTTYAAGRGAFRGSFENWSFRPDSRAADRTPFVIMRPSGLGGFATRAGAVRAAQRRQAAADRYALSRHRPDPDLSRRRQRQELFRRVLPVDARRERVRSIRSSSPTRFSTPGPTTGRSTFARCTTAARAKPTRTK